MNGVWEVWKWDVTMGDFAAMCYRLRLWQVELQYCDPQATAPSYRNTYCTHCSWWYVATVNSYNKGDVKEIESISRAQRPRQDGEKAMWIEILNKTCKINKQHGYSALCLLQDLRSWGAFVHHLQIHKLPINPRQAFPAVWHTVRAEREMFYSKTTTV